MTMLLRAVEYPCAGCEKPLQLLTSDELELGLAWFEGRAQFWCPTCLPKVDDE